MAWWLYTACVERDFPLEERALEAVPALLANLAGFARVYVTAGDGGPAELIKASRVFVTIELRDPRLDESWEIGICEEPWTPVFPGLKTANYWRHCDALTTARQRGFAETLLFNDHAELASACCANVFLVHGETILTPGRSSGCRAGVVREWVMKRRPVQERRLRREDVVNADEIFLTNSWIGVMPVATLEGRPLGPRRVGPKLAAEWEHRRASCSSRVASVFTFTLGHSSPRSTAVRAPACSAAWNCFPTLALISG
jgi:branched-subunit amino acid aminotransferase/4-amino-4-deoxychorismate lyase